MSSRSLLDKVETMDLVGTQMDLQQTVVVQPLSLSMVQPSLPEVEEEV